MRALARFRVPIVALLLLSVVTSSFWLVARQEQASVDQQLALAARQVNTQMSNDMAWSREQLLATARQQGMLELLRDPVSRTTWQTQVNARLLALTSANPGLIDEACLIDSRGAEQARVAGGAIAVDADLSDDESDNPFFRPTVQLKSGQVYNQTAYLSPDTNRWVLSWSTPLYDSTNFYGLFHFETPLAHYYDLVSKQVPYGGFIMLANRQGDIFLNTSVAPPQNQAFQYMTRLDADQTLRGAMQAEVTGGRSGFIGGKYHDKRYRLTYQTVELAPGMKATVIVAMPDESGVLPLLRPYAPYLALASLIALISVILYAFLHGTQRQQRVPALATGD